MFKLPEDIYLIQGCNNRAWSYAIIRSWSP